MTTLTDDSLNTLKTLGLNIDTARQRRRLSVKVLSERALITAQTYRRLRNGDPSVSLGVAMSVLQAMGLESQVANLVDPKNDDVGIGLEATWRQKHFRGDGQNELETNF